MKLDTALILQPLIRNEKVTRLTRSAETKLDEAIGLAEAISLEIIHHEILTINTVRAATLIGTGTIARIAELAEDFDFPLIIINTTLSPVQHRNLEEGLGCKVIDRTALILEIFGDRAQTHAGRLQVELAALSFQRSRLVRSWTHLERQRGGGGFLGGPGERQIELDRRMLLDQVKQIKHELNDVERPRHLQRRNRVRSNTSTIALVGYTNAGKSTLFNILTGANVLSKDMLFATLDPTMRGMELPSGREIVLADTVGFISDLPTELIEAFKSTLEEVIQADIILHVHDVSSPLLEEEASDVRSVLEDIGLSLDIQKERIINVYNKADIAAVPPDIDMFGSESQPQMITSDMLPSDGTVISALSGFGLDILKQVIDDKLGEHDHLQSYSIPPQHADASAWLYQHANVLHSEHDKDGNHQIAVKLSAADEARFERSWPNLSSNDKEALLLFEPDTLPLVGPEHE